MSGVWNSRVRALAALAVTAGVLSGCGLLSGRFVAETEGIPPERSPDPAYDQLVPYYVELCAVSQFRSKLTGLGGVPGHAAMYVKGACNDEASPYPRLRRCRRVASERDDPEHGAGVSVNRWFKNVNWVATPGARMFYEGNIEPGERLTRERFDEAIREGIEAGIFRGVELHDYPTEAGERSLEDFVMRMSLATDYALRFARTAFCARMPVTDGMLDEVIAFLNDLNHEYFSGEADYQWDGVSDNCVHTLRNALAAANIWSPLTVNSIRLRRFFNLAVPANEFVNLARLGAEGPIDDYGSIYGNGEMRDTLLEFDWLPTRQGAMLQVLPVHAENDLYETRTRMFVLQSPFRQGQMRAANRLLWDERFTDLKTNLSHFAAVYERILADRDDGFGMASLRGDRYRRLRRRYYAYIETQLAEVRAMQEQIGATPEAAASTP